MQPKIYNTPHLELQKDDIFITFEGVEGCGKSTQTKILKNYFESMGKEVVLTREPGGTVTSEKIRDILLDNSLKICSEAELFLFAAARAQHANELIRPSLEQKKVVISDRYLDSSYAYQGAARKLDLDLVDKINNIAICNVLPSLTIVLDIDPKEGLLRSFKRDDGSLDRMGSEKVDFYQKVRQGFIDLSEIYPQRVKIIDASGDKQTIAKNIQNLVKAHYGLV